MSAVAVLAHPVRGFVSFPAKTSNSPLALLVLVMSSATMLELRQDEGMMEESGKLVGRVQVIGTKLDSVSAKVDQLSTSVDERLNAVDQRFAAVDQRFDAVDRRFDELEAAIVEQRRYTEFAFTQLDHKMDSGFARLELKMDAGFARSDDQFARLERKLDQFIDVQVRTIDLVERRLRALESPDA
jgi:hypothetical protein